MRPRLIVIAGPNGSGKTSLTRSLQKRGYDFGAYINPDDTAATLEGSYEDRVRRAQALTTQWRQEAIVARKNFSYETVFSHPSKLGELEAARATGFEITLLFVGIDNPDINVERVRTRVQLGGHDVPEDRVIARYQRTMGMLPDMVERTDRAIVFDNTVQSTDPAAFNGRVVAQCIAHGDGIAVKLRSPIPAWTNRYLVEHARRRGWSIG